MKLAIVYDSNCGLCARVKEWILQQAPLVSIEFVAGGSHEARTRFPGLADGELAVVSDTGEVWLGNHAWIVCLWALRDYRDFAFRLTNPVLQALARQAFAVVSANRLAISRRFGLQPSDRELEARLRDVYVPRCQSGSE